MKPVQTERAVERTGALRGRVRAALEAELAYDELSTEERLAYLAELERAVFEPRRPRAGEASRWPSPSRPDESRAGEEVAGAVDHMDRAGVVARDVAAVDPEDQVSEAVAGGDRVSFAQDRRATSSVDMMLPFGSGASSPGATQV